MATKKSELTGSDVVKIQEMLAWIKEASEKISQLQSQLSYHKGKNVSLEAEIKELKQYKAWASKRLTSSEN